MKTQNHSYPTLLSTLTIQDNLPFKLHTRCQLTQNLLFWIFYFSYSSIDITNMLRTSQFLFQGVAKQSHNRLFHLLSSF